MTKLLRTVLIASFLFLTTQIYSQAYHPIPTDSAYWVEDQYDAMETANCIGIHYKYIYPTGMDTVLSGNTYHEFRYKEFYTYIGIMPGPNCPGNSTYHNLFYAYLRNDTAGKKVYVYNTADAQEYMAYDFDLSVGDTVSSPGQWGYYMCTNEVFIVDSIDSVDIGMGDYRKRFQVKHHLNNYQPYELIEGVGSSLGFLDVIACPFEATTDLVCFHHNAQEYFGSGNTTYCSATLSIEETTEITDLIKPVGPGKFSIQNEEGNSISLQVTDMWGRNIFTGDFTHTGSLDLSTYANGVYIINAVYNGQTVKPYKFILQP